MEDNGGHFKVCPNCGQIWHDRDAFLDDSNLHLLGYQVNFVELEEGLFLFHHQVPDCMTSLAVPVGAFASLYDGPIFEEKAAGTSCCPGFCLHEDLLDPCPARCECAYVREILQVVKNWNQAESDE